MAFHLENDGLAVAHVDDAGIFPRALNDPRSLGGKRPQPFLRGFVRTVLVPHGRADAKLGEARLASQQLDESVVFLRLKAVLFDEIGSDLCSARATHVTGGLTAELGIHKHDFGGLSLFTGDPYTQADQQRAGYGFNGAADVVPAQ